MKPRVSHTIFASAVVLLGASMACRAPAIFATPTGISSACGISIEPTSADLAWAAAFAEEAFDPDEWTRKAEIAHNHAIVTWTHTQTGELAYWQYLRYPCGYNRTDLDAYYSQYNLEHVFFADYQEVEFGAVCSGPAARLTLRELTADFAGRHYLIRFWADTPDELHTLTVSLVFLDTNEDGLAAYAKKIYPELPTCGDQEG